MAMMSVSNGWRGSLSKMSMPVSSTDTDLMDNFISARRCKHSAGDSFDWGKIVRKHSSTGRHTDASYLHFGRPSCQTFDCVAALETSKPGAN